MSNLQILLLDSNSKIAAGHLPILAMYARSPEMLIVGPITRDLASGAALSASVAWHDGTPGTYTALSTSSSFPGAVDSYQITYGSPVSQTFTQPSVTRDPATGVTTNVPAIVVS